MKDASSPNHSKILHRIALGIEYDGSSYCGWQRQKHSPSVQEELEKALSKVANEPINVLCAGRTDTGVHGSGQVVHFDTAAERSERNWMMGVSTNIERSVSILWAKRVEEFHARFSATARTYRYIIANTKHRPAILNSGVTWIRDSLDVDLMDRSLREIHGEHDFSSYRGSGCQSNSPNRCVIHTRVFRQNNLVVIEIKANAFLLHMVRNLVGQLLEVGRKKTDIHAMKRVLDLKDRTLASVTAPPFGLYLVKVDYPERFELPNSQLGPSFLSNI